MEFSEFNSKSKMQLLMKDGHLLNFKVVAGRFKVQLYKVYGFYVQCITDIISSAVVKIDIIRSKKWLEYD